MFSIAELCSVLVTQSAYRQSDDARTAVIAAVVVLVPLMIGLVQLLKHRRLMAEMRFKALERLAAQGTLRQDEIRELLRPGARGLRFFLVIAWFVMLIGMLLLGLALSDIIDHEAGIAGAIMSIVGMGALSAPWMLREMKRQGVL